MATMVTLRLTAVYEFEVDIEDESYPPGATPAQIALIERDSFLGGPGRYVGCDLEGFVPETAVVEVVSVEECEK